MLIYNYDGITKEYLGQSYADLDTEETNIQGKEVYLIPANATTRKPPQAGELEIVIFRNGGWEVVPDYRGLYMVNRDMQPKKVEELGVLPVGYVVITEEEAQTIEQDKDFYIIQNGELVVNPNYETIKRNEREKKFNQEFFQTSLGYVRRKFTNKNGGSKDFLSDAFPALLLAFKEGIVGEILVYDKPPFNTDVTDMTPYQHKVKITPQFIQECFNQTSIDFFG